MGAPAYQEALPLQLGDRLDFSTLVPGPNERAVRLLRDAVSRRANELFFVFGPASVGKTHLLQALHRLACGSGGAGLYIDVRQVRPLDPALLGFELPGAALVDNADAAAGDPAWELALFGLYNRWYDRRSGTLVLSASSSYDRIGFLRPDLATRLGSGVSLPLEYLDEAQCAEALCRRARGRGLNLPDATALFLVRHLNRDMGSLAGILARLDREGLRERRQLTVPFVKRVLRLQPPGATSPAG